VVSYFSLKRLDLPVENKTLKAKKSFVTSTVLLRLPWRIIPFVLSVFIIVEALTVAGWTNEIAMGLAQAIGPDNSDASAPNASFLFGSLGSFACNVLNNQPMTILFTRVLQSNFTVSATPTRGAMFGLILGSNFGANLTPVGALAGSDMLWVSIHILCLSLFL